METVTDTWQGWSVVSVRGDFVVRHLSVLRKALVPLLETPTPRIALDLSATRFIDSSALSMMLNTKRRCESRGGELVVFGANKELREIFSIVDLQQAIPTYTDRECFMAAVSD